MLSDSLVQERNKLYLYTHDSRTARKYKFT